MTLTSVNKDMKQCEHARVHTHTAGGSMNWEVALNGLVLPGGFEASRAYNQPNALSHTHRGFRARALTAASFRRVHREPDPNALPL